MDVGRQDGRTDGLRLNSGSFGTFWSPLKLANNKTVDLAQLLHGEKLRTDTTTNKSTKKQTHKQIYIATKRLKTVSLLSFVAGDKYSTFITKIPELRYIYAQ